MGHEIQVKIRFEAGHRLLDYSGKCHNVHGHTWIANLHFQAEKLIPPGMVVDFAEVKKDLKEWFEQNLDHAFMCNKDDPLGDEMELKYGLKVFRCPQGEPTTENLAKIVYRRAAEFAVEHSGVTCNRVEIQETPYNFASYEP